MQWYVLLKNPCVTEEVGDSARSRSPNTDNAMDGNLSAKGLACVDTRKPVQFLATVSTTDCLSTYAVKPGPVEAASRGSMSENVERKVVGCPVGRAVVGDRVMSAEKTEGIT